MSGKLPIMGCFATSRIRVKAYFIAKHHAHGSAGDNRLKMIDFTAESILGTSLPTVSERSSCKLQWKIRPASRKYTRDLVKTSREHKLGVKANKLKNDSNFATEEEHCLARANKKHCNLQCCCKSKCRKYNIFNLEWSPRVAENGVRLRIYKRIVGFKYGQKSNILDLKRAYCNNLKKSEKDAKSKCCP